MFPPSGTSSQQRFSSSRSFSGIPGSERSAELSRKHCFQSERGVFLGFPASPRYSKPMTQMLKKKEKGKKEKKNKKSI